MKRLLFIGSVVADVVIRTPFLPRTGEDLHLISQQVSLGGCAYNAFHTARLIGSADCMLFAPVGTGVWGDWVRRALEERGVVSAVPPVDAPNGCCYCLVEPDGERTFLSQHGAEYAFRAEWFDLLGDQRYDGVYLCGLEVEEPTGNVLIDYLTRHQPERLYFAPGPRLCRIPPERMAALMALHPALHLNAAEAAQFTRTEDVEKGAALLHGLTGNDVIITLGREGAYIRTGDEEAVLPGDSVQVEDTIGAGDAHIGALMAGVADGLSLAEAALKANQVSAAVVSQQGAELSQEHWKNYQQNRRMNP